MMSSFDAALSSSSGPLLILGATLITALLESLAVVGLLLPGVALLFAIAATAAHYEVHFAMLCTAAFIGGLAGDSISFALGGNTSFQAYLQPYLNRHKKIQFKARHLCERWGILALLVGRFIGPLRPFMPLSAGLLGMKRTHFYCTACFGGLLWAPVYLGPGYFVGTWPEDTIAIWLFTLFTLFLPVILQQTYRKVHSLYAGCTLLFFAYGAWLYFDTRNAQELYSTTLNLWGQSNFDILHKKWDQLFGGLINQLALTVTQTGNMLPTAFILITIGALFLHARNLSAFLWLACASIAPFLFKALFDIERPIGHHLEVTQSFPSGHTYFSLLIAFLLQEQALKHHKYFGIALFGWAGLVAMSRLVLEVHWVSDILGGWLLAIAVFGLMPKNTFTNTASFSGSTSREQ